MGKPNPNPNPAMNSEDRDEVTARILRVHHSYGGFVQNHLLTLAAMGPEPEVQKRVTALRQIQIQHDECEAEYQKEKAALDAKYQKIYQPLYSQRFDIVTGAVEVEGNDGTKNMAVLRDDKDKGVRSFWLIAMKNNKRIAEGISKKDEGALAFLTDIKWSKVELQGFKIDFFFKSTNPFFSNPVLTKTYCMIGEEILVTTLGSVIEWFPGKSLTGSDDECFSFFNFFTPLEVVKADDPAAEEMKQLMDRDYRIGITIRDKIIPHALYWFTGEALIEEHEIIECPDSDDQEFKDMDEDGYGDDDYDDEDDDIDEYEDDDEYYNVGNYQEKDDDDGASKSRKTH